MQWSDAIKSPSKKVLRQFAGLWLVFFLGLAAYRWFGGKHGTLTQVMAGAALFIGVPGLLVPALMRPIFTGWMIAAFPIGWTVARLVLAVVFFLVVTPIAVVFKLVGRDVLNRRRPSAATYWKVKPQPDGPASYLRQY